MTKLFAAALLAASALAAPAHATIYTFSMSVPYQITWQMDSRPEPYSVGTVGFAMYNWPVTVSPGSYYEGSPFIIFFGQGYMGFQTLRFNDPSIFFAGPTVFSGTLDKPVFERGTYQFDDESGNYPQLTISGVEAPEPATWGLMVLGFGLAGAAVRRRRVVAAV